MPVMWLMKKDLKIQSIYQIRLPIQVSLRLYANDQHGAQAFSAHNELQTKPFGWLDYSGEFLVIVDASKAVQFSQWSAYS